jgi:hypothetical protein
MRFNSVRQALMDAGGDRDKFAFDEVKARARKDAPDDPFDGDGFQIG